MAGLDTSDGVQVNDDGKVIQVLDLSEEAAHTAYIHHVGEPLSPEKPYFRVKVVRQAKDAPIAIGVSKETDLDAEDILDDDTASKKRPDALGYFSDNGTIATPARKGSEEYVQTYGQGDVVGCLVDYHALNKSLICVLKNDRIIYRRWVSIKANSLFPIINVWWGPVELHVNWLHENAPSLSMSNLSDWCMPDTVTSDDEHFSLRTSSRAVAIQSPFTWQEGSAYYFELTIVSTGDDAEEGPVIGLTSAIYEDDNLPGKMSESIGFSGANRCIYQQPKKENELNEECCCSVGDRMGCGFLFVDQKETNRRTLQTVLVYFTKNGEVVYHTALDQPVGGLFPTIGLAAAGCSVKVNVNCKAPSLPKADEWCKEAKNAMFAMFGLGDFIGGPPAPTGSRHEEGATKDGFRFADEIGPPSGDVIRPHKALRSKLIQQLQPLTRECPYFTAVMIDDMTDPEDTDTEQEEKDSEGIVSIGISRKGQTVGCFPGDLVDTVGYLSKGSIQVNGGKSTKTKSFTRGDVVGCYIEYFDKVKIVQFVKNGELVGVVPLTGGNEDIYPSIGFSREPCGVKVAWPSSKPQIPDMFSKDNMGHWLHSPGLKLNGKTFCIQKKTRKLRSMCIKSPQPLTRAWSYFEVTVTCNLLSKRTIGKKILTAPSVGLTNIPDDTTYKKLCQRNEAREMRFYCNTNSVGYKDALQEHRLTEINKKLTSGDRLGFGIVYPAVKNQPGDRACQVIIVYCTVNGSIIHHRAMEQPAGGFYPIISLFKYGDEVEIGNQCSPPMLPDMLPSWLREAEQLRKSIYIVKKAERPQTAAERRARASSPVERPDNKLNKVNLYIHCDSPRYNEASYIQAGLDEKGYTTTLLPQEKLNSSKIAKELLTCVKITDAVVCCIGPEISHSKHTHAVLALAKEYKKPALVCILDSVQWPPAGELQEEFSMLTMDKIEFTEDFEWGIGQIVVKSAALIGKGYNAKKIVVEDGDAAKLLYTDAQKDGKTMNKSSDPNALKKAVDDADKRKATSFGSDDRPKSTPPAKSSSNEPSFPRAQSAQPGRQVQRNSKACVLL